MAQRPSTGTILLLTTSTAIAAASCGSGGGGGGALPPGDNWFRTVVAGSGSPGALSGVADVILFDEAVDGQRSPDAPAAAPGNDVIVLWYSPVGTVVELEGAYGDGSFQASGEGWSFQGSFDGDAMQGTMSGPLGAQGKFAGRNASASAVGSFCGSFSGAGSGSWNLVVSQGGGVSGAFWGIDNGDLDGRANGDEISMKFRGEIASGSATGFVNASGMVQGEWSGTADSAGAVSGTWEGSTGSCSAPPAPPPVSEGGAPCPCAGGGGSGCCAIGGGASQCCYISTAFNGSPEDFFR